MHRLLVAADSEPIQRNRLPYKGLRLKESGNREIGVVALSIGKDQGLAIGNVLAVLSADRVITDRETKERVVLPNETIGELVIFRVFDRLAYALVVSASEAISVGATVKNP